MYIIPLIIGAVAIGIAAISSSQEVVLVGDHMAEHIETGMANPEKFWGLVVSALTLLAGAAFAFGFASVVENVAAIRNSTYITLLSKPEADASVT